MHYVYKPKWSTHEIIEFQCRPARFPHSASQLSRNILKFLSQPSAKRRAFVKDLDSGSVWNHFPLYLLVSSFKFLKNIKNKVTQVIKS
jgi:hypothetical protein